VGGARRWARMAPGLRARGGTLAVVGGDCRAALRSVRNDSVGGGGLSLDGGALGFVRFLTGAVRIRALVGGGAGCRAHTGAGTPTGACAAIWLVRKPWETGCCLSDAPLCGRLRLRRALRPRPEGRTVACHAVRSTFACGKQALRPVRDRQYRMVIDRAGSIRSGYEIQGMGVATSRGAGWQYGSNAAMGVSRLRECSEIGFKVFRRVSSSRGSNDCRIETAR
jgi:hypothetical protein